jgi:capsular exopolysaccharide synthesis family protein
MALNNAILGEASGTLSKEEEDYVEIYIQSLTDRSSILEAQIAQLDRDFNIEQKKASAMQEFLLKDQSFSSSKDRTEMLHAEVVARLKEIDLIRDYGGDTMTVTAQPLLGEKVAPRLLVVLAGSLILGSLIGACVAWGIDASEKTFRSTKEIRNSLGVPVVGSVPPMEKSEMAVGHEFPSFGASLATVHREGSAAAEAFRGVRTNLYFSTAAHNQKVIQVTSPLPGDGKSTVTANLAVSIAKSGKSVLVIDADFRRPTMDKLLGLQSTASFGLAAAITGEVDPADAPCKTEIDNLFFIPVKERPRQPSELLSTPEFAELLKVYREKFDFVLVDTPPILAVSDPGVVAARVDGVLLTMRIRNGVQVTSSRSMEVLKSLQANVIGVIANGWESSGEYGYGYGHGYGSESYLPSNGKTKTNGNGRIAFRKPLTGSRN